MGDERPVVVVGAGPVGLASALALRARGLPVLVHFAVDRREAAEYNRAAAGAALVHMQARDPRIRRKRRLAAAVSPVVKRAGRWLDTAPYGPRVGRAGHSGRY